MPRIDYNRSPLRNPFGQETPGRILFRKWNNEVMFEKGWWRAYGLSVVATFFLVPVLYLYFLVRSSSNSGLVFLFLSVLGIIYFLFLAAKFQLAIFPALYVMSKSRESMWVYFRMTLAGGHTAAYAMFFFALNRCVLPSILIHYFYICFWTFIKYSSNPLTYVLLIPLTILVIGLLSLLLSGLAFLGLMIKKDFWTVLLTALSPVLLLIIFNLNSLRTIFYIIWNWKYDHQALGPLGLFLFPEFELLQSIPLRDWTSDILLNPSTYQPLLSIILWLGGLAALVWLGLWAWLKISLPEPKLEKQL